LVVEVDGVTHQDEETALKDKNRERELERVGFKVK
jgi:very-short-patch-repair endonuclease